jgi:hypothetical protein
VKRLPFRHGGKPFRHRPLHPEAQRPAGLVVVLRQYRAERMQARPQTPVAMAEQHGAFQQRAGEAPPQGFTQQVEAAAIARREPEPGLPVLARLEARHEAFDAVDLVVHPPLRQPAGADLGEYGLHRGDARLALGIGGIHHVQQQIGLAGFGEGRAEGRHQLMRQVAHEADGVGEQQWTAGQALHPPHGRIEGGEELVGGIHRAAGEGVEQGGLPGIGVAHQGHPRQGIAHPGAAHLRLLHLDARKPLLQGIDARTDQPAVGLQRGLARAAQADGAAALGIERPATPHEARGLVLQLRQFHLQLALGAGGAQGEDVEDQTHAVDHATTERIAEIALLHWAQRGIDQHEIDAGGLAGILQLLDLAAAKVMAGAGALEPGLDEGHHLGTGGAGQFGELLGQRRIALPRNLRLHQQGAGRRGAHASRSSPSPAASPVASVVPAGPPPGPRRTLREGTTVEMACL